MSFRLMGAFNCNLMTCIARHEGIHPMSDASPIANEGRVFHRIWKGCNSRMQLDGVDYKCMNKKMTRTGESMSGKIMESWSM